ncbi:MAG TPA: helix-turn-helix domain-containing protein [Polyangiaceae bacterium]|nr:helix-turn-helix domain-containing protein [Polyangiaceae bacterium]
MERKRSYQQHCGVARSLDVLGERWTLLILRDLLLGPRRYGELLGSLEGITTNLLAKRLREMTQAGLVEKRAAGAPASGEVYALTEAGRAVEPVLMELGRFGGRFLEHPRRGDRRDIGWALLSLKRRYMGGIVAVVEIVSGERRFELSFTRERLTIEERASDRATVRLAAAGQGPLFELFFGGVPCAALERKGIVAVEGDRPTLGVVLAALGASSRGPSRVDAGTEVR